MKKFSIFSIRHGLNYWINMAIFQSLAAIFFAVFAIVTAINKIWLLSGIEIFFSFGFIFGSIHYWRKYSSHKQKMREHFKI
jgi:hypothetical protein